jgi:hypothetical protein
MPLHRLYNLATGTMNPSYLTGLQPGGAGVQVTGVNTNPGISAPRLEESTIEVLDVTAPTLIGTANAAGTVLSTPAIAGKLLQISPSGIGGSRWKQNSSAKAAIARGQYGIVVAAAPVQQAPAGFSDAGPAVGTANGNEAAYGSKAVVMYDGPTQAFVQTTVGGNAISAGMALQADGAGNLTAYTIPAAGLPPGTTLATYLGPTLATNTSIPVLSPVYVGGY